MWAVPMGSPWGLYSGPSEGLGRDREWPGKGRFLLRMRLWPRNLHRDTGECLWKKGLGRGLGPAEGADPVFSRRADVGRRKISLVCPGHAVVSDVPSSPQNLPQEQSREGGAVRGTLAVWSSLHVTVPCEKNEKADQRRMEPDTQRPESVM